MGTGAAPPLDEQVLVKALKALGDATRFRMMQEIADAGELSCGQVAALFDISQPTISHHLKMLRSAGLLDCERRGTWVYYWVIPTVLQQLSSVLNVNDRVIETSPQCCP